LQIERNKLDRKQTGIDGKNYHISSIGKNNESRSCSTIKIEVRLEQRDLLLTD